jgi:hypothetical protein
MMELISTFVVDDDEEAEDAEDDALDASIAIDPPAIALASPVTGALCPP